MGCRINSHDVKTYTLRSVLREHLPAGWSRIDFLKVDVEGHEREVLDGMCWDEIRPRVVVVEALRPNHLQPSHESWEDILIKEGYVCMAFDGGNRYYASTDDEAARKAFSMPICLFDNYIDSARLQTIEWIANNLNMRLGDPAAIQELKSLGQLLALMQESPGMLNLRPSQLDQVLSKLITTSGSQ